MEATGVYWIAYYNMPETSGIKVSLINPAAIKQRKGKKNRCKGLQMDTKNIFCGVGKRKFYT